MKRQFIMKTFQLANQFLFIMALSFTTNVLAQEQREEQVEETKEISLTGSIDTYFHRSFGTIEKAPRTSFSNLPGFSLGMINLIAGYKEKKSGFVVDVVLGPRGSDAVFNAPLYKNASGGSSSQIINQMYAYYQISKNIKLNAGQFNTFLSYEVISPAKNYHYSTSYLFSYGPFNHTGVWADIDLKKGWTAKLAVMNPTDYTEFNPFDSYTLGGQIGFTKEKRSFYLNATYGDPDGKLNWSDTTGCVSKGMAMQIDMVATINFSSRYTAGVSGSYRKIGAGQIRTTGEIRNSVNADYGFYGSILYQKITFSDFFSVGLRTEYFSEFKGGVGAIGMYNDNGKAFVFANTLSANITSSNFKFIPELRVDKTSGQTFTKNGSHSPVSVMTSVNMAVVYTIPSITHKFNNKK
jgi:hypothetical protein